MEISAPRRILAVSLSGHSDLLGRVVKDLTGTQPFPSNSSLAGVTHNLALKTPYYSATVPIWLDLVDDPSEWADAFLSPEAKVVLTALGGLVVVFPTSGEKARIDAAKKFLQEAGRVVQEGLGGWSWDGVTLAVGVGAGAETQDLEQWEESCAEANLEFVYIDTAGVATAARNEFGEKTGISRVIEALEANDWTDASIDDVLSDEDPEFGDFEQSVAAADVDDPDNLGLGITGDDADALRAAILGTPRTGGDIRAEDDDVGDSSDVDKVERMMQRLLAAREAGQGMGEEQRRRLAARAVAEVMREL